MNYRTAKMSLSVTVVTVVIVAITAGCILGGFLDKDMVAGGLVMGIIALGCYLSAPASYDLSNGCLTVVLHAGKRSFGPIVRCTRLAGRLPFTLRLFGNGGLFAGTGIFWNKPFGIFRAYVTSARPGDAVLVQTTSHKVLITPENPQVFVESAQPTEAPH